MTRPTLRGGRGTASSAVLVLHGGREHGRQPTSPLQASYLRMLDLYAGLRHTSADCAVYLLRHGVRGWNPGLDEPSPVTDARWALEQIRARHPGAPIALLGHSMGGRTAFAVADASAVIGVCALAPWLPEGEALPSRTDVRCVLAHGTADRMTSPVGTRAYSSRLRRHGNPTACFEQQAGRHALLDAPTLWRRFAVASTLGLVGDRPLPAGVVEAMETGSGADGCRGLHTFVQTAGSRK